MPTGEQIEKRGHIVGFQEEIEKVSERSAEQFFTWFNNAESIEDAFIQGAWDFSLHFAYILSKNLIHPESKTALEIGYGGGRILASACRHFKKVIGIDVHSQQALVAEELYHRGIKNFELTQTDGKRIPVIDNSIDVVYSFIVLQHVEKIDIFVQYLHETYRALKSGGVACLYFGRFCRFSLNHRSVLCYWIDRLCEFGIMPKGYLEIPARVNETNLRVRASFATKLGKQEGFTVEQVLSSRRKASDGFLLFGGQHGMVLKK
jgi:SAM-dependent methyltransferase